MEDLLLSSQSALESTIDWCIIVVKTIESFSRTTTARNGTESEGLARATRRKSLGLTVRDVRTTALNLAQKLQDKRPLSNQPDE